MPGHRNPKIKESRWDRIRKRNMLNAGKALKNDTVKRFIEMDFIGKHNDEMLRGENDGRPQLNPLIVMEMRHENIKSRFKRYSTNAGNEESHHLSCRSHNIAVEEHYIKNELNKLRSQLHKNHERSKKIQEKAEANLCKPETLVASLTKASKCIESYYAAPIEAIDEFEKICDSYEKDALHGDDNEKGGDIESALNESARNAEADPEFKQTRTQIDQAFSWAQTFNGDAVNSTVTSAYTRTTVIESADLVEQIMTQYEAKITTNGVSLKPEIYTNFTPTQEAGFQTTTNLNTENCLMQNHENLPARYVHFDQELDIIDYKPELCSSTYSNTSDGIDSVISDIAEEALMELNMEEEELLKSQRGVNAEDDNLQSVDTKIALPEQSPDGGGVNQILIIQSMPLKQLPGRKEPVDQPIEIITNAEASDDESSVSNHEQNLIIEQLFQARAHTNIVLKRKYFLKWIHYTTIAKIERENCTRRNDRVQKINMFLDKIRKEKVRQTNTNGGGEEQNKEQQEELRLQKTGTVQIKKKYQNKIKIQQDIIDLQRLKLERQERLIMELKLNKLSDEAKEARQEIKDQLKSVIRCGDAKTKAKAKCLQLIGGADLKDVRGDAADDEDEFTRLRGRRMMMPKFLENMQERALERSVRHEQAKQRRLQHDAEREAQKVALEEAKRLEDEESKRLRIEALQEKRRLEKQAKIIKERERQEAIENHRKAQEFCRRLLLRRVGMEGFKRLLQRKRDIKAKCLALRRNLLQRCYFNAWRNFYVQTSEEKQLKADNLHTKILLRTGMRSWLSYVMDERSKWFVAVDWHDLKLSDSILARWAGYAKRQRMIQDAKMNKAVSHHEWHLKWKVLDRWQRLSHILQLERETEERRQRWRMKIWDLLPDYSPNPDEYD